MRLTVEVAQVSIVIPENNEVLLAQSVVPEYTWKLISKFEMA